MLSLELPVERGDKWVLEFGATYFEVTPGHGARITSLRCDGQELLMQHGADNFEDALGSTFWPSPQSWPWPPPPELDTLPYAVQGDGAAGMLLKSEPHAGTQLALQKRFRADLLREAVVLDYTLTNVGSEPSQWAPWEITRMPSDGLAFWPTGGAPSGDSPAVSSALGHTWWQAADTEGEGKLFADGAGGYLAYVTSGCILIKRFQDQPASAAAPGEAEIELYVNGEHSYVEVENQGAYASLAPGASLSWQVTWYVRKLPAGMSPAPGNADLIAFVSETLQ